MLKKIDYYYDEDGERIDIEDEKIYWDTNMNQFRHKFTCCECGKPIGCRCYEELGNALTGIEEGIICDACGVALALEDVDVSDLMDCLDEDRNKQVQDFVESLLTEKEIDDFIVENGNKNIDWDEKLEIVGDAGKDSKLKEFVVGLMTDEEKFENYDESCCEYPKGDACEI